jgi:hypothetical protein
MRHEYLSGVFAELLAARQGHEPADKNKYRKSLILP